MTLTTSLSCWLPPLLLLPLPSLAAAGYVYVHQVTCSQAPLLGGGAQEVLALVGSFTFKAGTVLAAVTKAEKVCWFYTASTS